MTDHPDNLERELATLTSPDAAEVALWKAALSSVRRQSSSNTTRGSIFTRRIPQGALAAAAVVILSVLLVGAILPSLGKARSSTRFASVQAPSVSASPLTAAEGLRRSESDRDGNLSYGYYNGFSSPEVALSVSGVVPSTPDAGRVAGLASASPRTYTLWERPPEQSKTASSDRFVIRKAQLELQSKDVRAAFIKAAMLLSEAQGEYIEESSLTGQDAQLDKDGNLTRPSTLAASLKLRVTATRLGAVLAQLRELGSVVSETAGGEDVTEQMVDLEARIRNEQRVETELLSLLESRKGEPLEGILKLRDSIGSVRQNIERMNAQRERLSRLVSLATVLVIIRTDATPAPVAAPPQESLGDYFLKGLKNAYTRGVHTLADSAAWLVQSLIGGLPWWLLLTAAILALRLAWRRYQRAMAAEPAPRA